MSEFYQKKLEVTQFIAGNKKHSSVPVVIIHQFNPLECNKVQETHISKFQLKFECSYEREVTHVIACNIFIILKDF